MRLDFTAAADRAMQRAMALALSARADVVGAVDLFCALIAENEGRAATLLDAAGLGPLRAGELFPSAIVEPSLVGELPLAEAMHDVLAHARELARIHGAEGSIGSEHLLLAVLEADSKLLTILTEAGLDWQALRDKIAPVGEALHLDEALDFTSPAEAIDLARILDAAANRAREALRVLEDFARFTLDDSFLTRAFKEIRHALAEALDQFPAQNMLHARDTLADVGAAISTVRESERDSIESVVVANAKRLQESLRSLEEYGKLYGSDLGRTFEQLRYRAYTLEKALLVGSQARTRLADARLYVLVTERLCRASLLGTVSEALAGGAQIIQLREKEMSDRRLLETARAVRELTRKAGALFIVNDRPDIALLSDADGVHLGQDDMSLRDARRVLGPCVLIGISTHNLEQVRRAVLEGAGYIGVGPTFPSQTKEFSEFANLAFVRQATAETNLPAFILGGITPQNLPQVLAAGGKRIAVSHAICSAPDPRFVAAELRKLSGDA